MNEDVSFELLAARMFLTRRRSSRRRRRLLATARITHMDTLLLRPVDTRIARGAVVRPAAAALTATMYTFNITLHTI